MRYLNFLLVLVVLVHFQTYAQKNVSKTGKYKEYKNEFFEDVKEASKEYFGKNEAPKKVFKADLSSYKIPESINEFKYYWHQDPADHPQGNTGTCWDFCTLSFFESEIFRQRAEKIKLSEMFVAYWEFVEKARRFIKKRGKSYFSHGSESNAVMRIWKKYGAMPLSAYSGLGEGQKYHDHSKMYSEMNSFLENLKESNAWNEKEAIETIKSILNHYMGVPPESFEVDGKMMTAKEYFQKVVRLNDNDYVEFLSTIKHQYYSYTEFEVPDNWWHSKDYLNIPLDEFMQIINNAVRNGYTVCIGGDVSEPGLDAYAEAAIIPEFDIPSANINEYSREYRFNNESTTDDHGIHLIGYKETDDKNWYLIKDSGSGSRNGKNIGYYFYHEDFVKLKMLSFMVHKEAAKALLDKIK